MAKHTAEEFILSKREPLSKLAEYLDRMGSQGFELLSITPRLPIAHDPDWYSYILVFRATEPTHDHTCVEAPRPCPLCGGYLDKNGVVHYG